MEEYHFVDIFKTPSPPQAGLNHRGDLLASVWTEVLHKPSPGKGSGDWTLYYSDSLFSSLFALIIFACWSLFSLRQKEHLHMLSKITTGIQLSNARGKRLLLPPSIWTLIPEMDCHWTYWASVHTNQPRLPRRWWVWPTSHAQSSGPKARLISERRGHGNKELSLSTMATHDLCDLEQHTWTFYAQLPHLQNE